MFNRKIGVFRDWERDSVFIMPKQRNDDLTMSYDIPVGAGKWQRKIKNDGESYDTDELLRFDIEDAEKLLIGLVKVFGYPERQALVDKLEACEYHLEDMRKLVFKT
jgi:hypothetical protein